MLKESIIKLAVKEGLNQTGLDGVDIYRLDKPFPKTTSVLPPSICFIIQGEKVVYLGEKHVNYSEGQFLLGSLRMPVESELKKASPENPYLGLVLKIDSSLVSELLFHVGNCESWEESKSKNELVGASPITKDLETSLNSLLNTLSNPMDTKVLGSAHLKEVYYRVLLSPIGHMLRNSAIQHSKAHQIAPAIQYIEKNFRESITIDQLTKVAAMSATSLHEAFKNTTSLSPIQFIKKLRLHNAFTLLTSGRNATESAFASGYTSPAQFSREFKRQFGISPSEVKVA